MFRRISLFLLVNILVVLTISLILRLFNVQPYLTRHGLDYQSLLIFCFIWGMGGAFISLLLSKKMAKWLMRVQIISKNSTNMQHQKLVQMVEKLSRDIQLGAMPEVGIFPSQALNAFATGASKSNSLVAISQGLLDTMTDGELEAILAHEISHIENGDMVTMTLLQGIVNAFVMFLARVLAYAISSNSRNKSSSKSFLGYYGLVIVFEIAFMILGSLIVSAFSRFREYRADYGGALLSSKSNMINALRKLETIPANGKPLPKAMNALMIFNRKRGFGSLFASHPSIANRIERLENQHL